MKFEFEVLGPPQAKQRPRFARRGNFVQSFTPQATIDYENLVRMSYQVSEGPMFEDTLRATIVAYFPIPKSTSKKKTQLMESGMIYHTKRPDADNIAKSILDALNNIAFHDDSIIAELIVIKKYSNNPRVVVTLENIGGEE